MPTCFLRLDLKRQCHFSNISTKDKLIFSNSFLCFRNFFGLTTISELVCCLKAAVAFVSLPILQCPSSFSSSSFRIRQRFIIFSLGNPMYCGRDSWRGGGGGATYLSSPQQKKTEKTTKTHLMTWWRDQGLLFFKPERKKKKCRKFTFP